MDAAAIQPSNFSQTDLSAGIGFDEDIEPVSTVFDASELTFELGLWLSSLRSFLSVQNYAFAEETRSKTAARDWTKEFRLTHSCLAICSELTFRLGKALEEKSAAAPPADSTHESNKSGIDADEIYSIAESLKNAILLNETLLRAAPLKFGEWTAWTHLLAEKLENLRGFPRLVEIAETESADFLPPVFHNLLRDAPLALALETDLKIVLPRFAKILKSLSVIERMLKNDEPLKPSLLIFARIYEQINELIKYVDNRLLRFPDDEDKLFGALDGTAYTASIELRKVYSHELAGLAELRPTPTVYARIETAHSLLNDSFQQTLVNFAQLVKPEIKGEEIFPNFNLKLRQSLLLRQNLSNILETVKKTERNPEKMAVVELHTQLNDFLAAPLHFLFYKDMETLERFIEEILITDNKKDLVPILHRFGAYLETLFGQVNMRAVLAEHPFEK